MNYVFYSEYEGYKLGAEKIKIEAIYQGKKCELVTLDEIVNIKVPQKHSQKLLGYFLTNDINIPNYIKLLKQQNFVVINQHMLLGDTSKFTLQQKIASMGISIPKSVLCTEPLLTNKIPYPRYIKSKKQVGEVIFVENNVEIEEKLSQLNSQEYYIEEAICNKNMVLRKFYYIDGIVIEMSSSGTKYIPEWFTDILKNICISLNLKVFSTDIFIDWTTKMYFCIDINPASAFFNSDNARKEFVSRILL